MSKIEIWKCDYHKKCYFESKPEYRKHLRELAAGKISSRHYRKTLKELSEITKVAREQLCIQDVLEYMIENQEAFVMQAILRENNETFRKLIKAINLKWTVKIPKILDITIGALYSPRVSNSHHCPKDGARNWAGKRGDLPTSYPGWRGTLDIHFDTCDVTMIAPSSKKGQRNFSHTVYVGSGLFGNSCIHTGTGGGGTHTHFAAYIFEDDWPSFTPTRAMAKLAADNPESTVYLDEIGSGRVAIDTEE